MNSLGKSVTCRSTLREKIKIHTVRISSRKSRTSNKLQIDSANIESETLSYTNHRSSSTTSSTMNSRLSASKMFSISQEELFTDIQEINEHPENEEDSLIYELNEMLNLEKNKKPTKISDTSQKKSKLSIVKIKLKKNIPAIKTERNIPRVNSQRLIL